jgi:membrane-associated protease RseP (regulator of RpoE activity)
MIVQTLLYLAFALITHELGHYLVAKALGFKVSQFHIGMGWELFKFNTGETEFLFKIAPFAGHIRLDIDIPNLTRAEKFKSTIVCLAGPAVNIVLGILLFRYDAKLALMSLFSGLGNLIPIFPGSDGQQFIAYTYSAITHKDK